MGKSVRVEVDGMVTGWELASLCFHRSRVPIESMFVVMIGNEHFHGVSAKGEVFWRLNDLERVLKPGNWMRTFGDTVCGMAVLSNTDYREDFSLFDSVFLADTGLFQLFTASISKMCKEACSRWHRDLTSNGAMPFKVTKCLKIELSPGHLTASDVPNVDKLKLAPMVANEVAKMKSENGKISERAQHNIEIYRILSRVNIETSNSKATSLKSCKAI